MPKFALIASIEVAPGRRDEFLPLLRAHAARCLKDEPGTLQFDVLLPHDDGDKVMLYELYQDQARLRRAFERTVARATAQGSRRHDGEGLGDEVLAFRVSVSLP
jgi:quinol monooxygenase YgiN